MRKILISVFAVVFAFGIATAEDRKAQKDHFEDVKELFQDISILNLVNGLNLTVRQMTDLYDISREAKRNKEKFYAEYSGLAENTKNYYAILKAQLITKGSEVSPKVQSEAGKMEKEGKDAREKHENSLKELESKACNVLSAGQLQIISDFKPCLIPPKSLKNPSRVGQAYDSGHMEEMLKRVREMKQEEFENKTDSILERIISKEEKMFLGELNEEERSKEKQRLLNVINKVRSMKDADFELEKGELAKEVDLGYEKDQSLKTLQKLNKAHEKLGKVARFLLDERIIPILEQKIKIAKSFTKPKTNLDNVTPAEEGSNFK